MSSNLLIGNWASGAWAALGGPSSVSALTISGYAVTDGVIGNLNSLIGTCYQPTGFSGVGTYDYDITPDISSQELSLIGLMFTQQYYSNLAQSTMGVGGLNSANGLPVQSLAEGDTKIGYANAASIGAVYLGLATQAKKDLDKMVGSYINNTLGANIPISVVSPNIIYGGGNWSAAGWGLG